MHRSAGTILLWLKCQYTQMFLIMDGNVNSPEINEKVSENEFIANNRV